MKGFKYKVLNKSPQGLKVRWKLTNKSLDPQILFCKKKENNVQFYIYELDLFFALGFWIILNF